MDDPQGTCSGCGQVADLVAIAPGGGLVCRRCQLSALGLRGAIDGELAKLIRELDGRIEAQRQRMKPAGRLDGPGGEVAGHRWHRSIGRMEP